MGIFPSFRFSRFLGAFWRVWRLSSLIPVAHPADETDGDADDSRDDDSCHVHVPEPPFLIIVKTSNLYSFLS